MEVKLWAPWAISCKKGQAILELAIFGSILIMLLGILINYGLKYNFQQQVMQEAFRKALGVTAVKRSSYVLIKDRHIPDPSNPFGIGGLAPVTSSASVTRNYELHKTADSEAELPRMYLEVNGEIDYYKMAGFDSEGEMDFTMGEIMDYDSCKAECLESGNKQWYCSKLDTLFPKSADKFPDGRPMGVQQDYARDMRIGSETNGTKTTKIEGTSNITTTDYINWQNDVTRTIVYRPYGDKSGNTVTKEIISDVHQAQTYEWETPF